MADIRDLLYNDPRYQRANRFANHVLSLMRDFVPTGRDVQRLMHDRLWEIAAMHNLEIIEVPPECDTLDKLALQHKRYEKSLAALPPVVMPIAEVKT